MGNLLSCRFSKSAAIRCFRRPLKSLSAAPLGKYPSDRNKNRSGEIGKMRNQPDSSLDTSAKLPGFSDRIAGDLDRLIPIHCFEPG